MFLSCTNTCKLANSSLMNREQWNFFFSKNYRFTGPFAWPIFGNLFLIRKLSRKYKGQHNAFTELSKHYNSDVIAFRLASNRYIMVSGYEGVKTILHGDEYDGRPWTEFAKLRNMGLRKGACILYACLTTTHCATIHRYNTPIRHLAEVYANYLHSFAPNYN